MAVPVPVFLEREQTLKDLLSRYADEVNQWCGTRDTEGAALQSRAEIVSVLVEFEHYRADIIGLRRHFHDSPEVRFVTGTLLPLIGGASKNNELDERIVLLADLLAEADMILPPALR